MRTVCVVRVVVRILIHGFTSLFSVYSFAAHRLHAIPPRYACEFAGTN